MLMTLTVNCLQCHNCQGLYIFWGESLKPYKHSPHFIPGMSLNYKLILLCNSKDKYPGEDKHFRNKPNSVFIRGREG